MTYDPRRLKGVNAYKETTREFATGDRIQFTAQDKDLKVANRDLGTITGIEPGNMTVRLAGKTERTIVFDPDRLRSLDYGYAVTSHSSQGLTERRVIVNMDTEAHRNLINTRLAYVALSRAAEEVRIYTNDALNLAKKLATDISKTSAVDFRPEQTEEPARKQQQPTQQPEAPTPQRRTYEYADPNHRLAAVALDYASKPEKTVVLAPDRAERQELMQLIRADLYAQGKLGAEAREVSVLVQQKIRNTKLAAEYTAGEKIHFSIGSPSLEGIPHNSVATVVSADPKRNLLTIRTDAERLDISYNPLHLKAQTKGSTVYREETRELAEGERIQFTMADKDQGIRKGDLATVTRIEDNHALTLRMDNGKTVELDPAKARHIDYGYAADGSQRVSADRVIATGETLDQKTLQAVPFKTPELTLYTSHNSGPQKQEQIGSTQPIALPNPQHEHSQRQQQDFSLGF